MVYQMRRKDGQRGDIDQVKKQENGLRDYGLRGNFIIDF